MGSLRDFAGRLGARLAESLGVGRSLTRVCLIVSPPAGGLRHHDRLEAALKVAESNGGQTAPGDGGPPGRPSLVIRFAERKGQPRDLAAAIVREADNRPGTLVVVSVGGDGTHNEVLSGLLDAGSPPLPRLFVIRVPAGTGNDGADFEHLGQIDRLARATPVEISGVRLRARGGANRYAFNIASVGIDAFVGGLTNRLKTLVPGDGYKLAADIATLLYEPIYGVRPLRIEVEGADGSRRQVEDRFILAAFGASGRRSYGDHKRILPDVNNLCAIRTRGLFEKIRLKPHLFAGTHLGLDGVVSAFARRITLDYPGRLPAQVDGESFWLEREDFPCVLEVIPTGLFALQSKM